MCASEVLTLLELSTKLQERSFLFHLVHLEEPYHLIFDFLFVLDEIVKLLLCF